MMRRLLLLILPLMGAGLVLAAPAPPEGPIVIRLAPQAVVKLDRAFRYRLLPGREDRVPGNAAPLWRLAVDAYRDSPHKMTNAESDWATQTSLNKLPRKDVQAFLGHYDAALRLARQAACRTHCDWELPPLTIQSLPDSMQQRMIQTLRTLVVVLSIQYRLHLIEGHFTEAAETLQTGFALARHLCEGEMVIHNLVGIAIATIMLGKVEEWVQLPGSPNLYWALTELPRPFGRLRHAIEYELGTYYRSFPALRRLRRETWTAQQTEDLVKDVFGTMSKLLADTPKRAQEARMLGESIRAAEQYPQARKYLLDAGRTTKEIDTLPRVQVVLLWHLERYDRAGDMVLKGLVLPPWQAKPLLDAAEKELGRGGESSDLLTTLLMPTLLKTWIANVRIERSIAGLRCAEALREYAAAHGGKSPAKWTDITEVPLPVDPLTGKGFDAYYQVMEGHGILELPPPPPPGMPASLGRRYELAAPKVGP
jgi:hypothetical protein